MNILIVEDEPNIASFEKLELEHEGYTVTLAQTGLLTRLKSLYLHRLLPLQLNPIHAITQHCIF